jgi:hypothetical protein
MLARVSVIIIAVLSSVVYQSHSYAQYYYQGYGYYPNYSYQYYPGYPSYSGSYYPPYQNNYYTSPGTGYQPQYEGNSTYRFDNGLTYQSQPMGNNIYTVTPGAAK